MIDILMQKLIKNYDQPWISSTIVSYEFSLYNNVNLHEVIKSVAQYNKHNRVVLIKHRSKFN